MSSPQSDSSISPPATINTSSIKGRGPINTSIYPELVHETSDCFPNCEPVSNDVENETDDEEYGNERNQQSDSSPFRRNSLSKSNLSLNHENDENNSSNVEPVRNSIPEPRTTATPSDQKPIKSNKWIIIIGIVISLLVAVYISHEKQSTIAEKEREMASCSAFLNFNNQFPNQDVKLWKALKVGIEGTFNDKKTLPSVFALFSNDKDTMRSIMSRIVSITQQCTHSTEYPLNISKTELSSREFQEDHTKLILNFKDKLEKQEVMILNDIDKVPISVLPSLHSFCDTYNPLVAKSIIFLTIHVLEEPSEDEKPVEFIYNYLKEKWIDVPSNIRDPLITRITDQTFFLNKENV
ncbi:unnamed protein product [Diamesa hyperborea]